MNVNNQTKIKNDTISSSKNTSPSTIKDNGVKFSDELKTLKTESSKEEKSSEIVTDKVPEKDLKKEEVKIKSPEESNKEVDKTAVKDNVQIKPENVANEEITAKKEFVEEVPAKEDNNPVSDIENLRLSEEKIVDIILETRKISETVNQGVEQEVNIEENRLAESPEAIENTEEKVFSHDTQILNENTEVKAVPSDYQILNTKTEENLVKPLETDIIQTAEESDIIPITKKDVVEKPPVEDVCKKDDFILQVSGNKPEEEIVVNSTEEVIDKPILSEKENKDNVQQTEEIINGLQNVVNEMNKFTRPNDKETEKVKFDEKTDDNKIVKSKKFDKKDKIQKNEVKTEKTEFIPKEFSFERKTKKFEEKELIDNNINVHESKEKLLNAQTGANMNFNSNGQPFSEFVNTQSTNNNLVANEADLAEESAILSTMSENIAIANKNIIMSKAEKEKPSISIEETPENTVQPKTRTVVKDDGIKKVDRKTNVVVETVVKYDSVVMDKADVEFFTNLVENGSVEVREVVNNQKSTHVSKALADLINKAMENNKPIRIDFDNDISVIIKISKEGKISADFLPSSQIAEAYLKENLPLLRQKFDDNNIEYDELNQRKQKQDNQENRKKGRKDE